MPPTLAADGAVRDALGELAGWRRAGRELRCTYRFPDFRRAAEFTMRLAAVAEAADHHPEWTVRYREVDVATTTHAAHGITALDLALAAHAAAAAAFCGGAPVRDGGTRAGDATPGAGLWRPPGHFYSPVTDPEEIERDAARLFDQGPRELPGIDLRIAEQRALAIELSRYYGDEDFAEVPRADRRYCLANDYFPYGDAFVYQALLRHLRPRRVVEIGAGWSSAVLLDTDERFLGNSIDCTFVDPFPERLLSLLHEGDHARCRLLPHRVQDVPFATFAALEAGDVLFVDSSHVLKTGSDVACLLFEVLPCLQAGVWVHFHDVHANFEYAPAWVREGRSWNEAYALRAFLLHNDAWRIELHGATLALHAAHELLPLMPRLAIEVGGSLWLRKV